ncbi:tRNA-dependent cyclodipeptide synthase [Streptomyces sp. HU2014]|uniref:tRNA-dependent cyclodipeptide synthase n=1 Tax=Streptomyces sp. HU2014 TaxID=2939414 RepID=UPI00200CEE48|nr:tRNA-dependent cyclodipeptide synthase [Streptomyces sp. HU2014]UQI46105.1 tRNA-dependent cyclodipeptide synthase [Streptomyces sp. HU2014]
MEFLVQPCTAESRRILARAEHLLIGLSPWNGYYKPHRIEALVDWACANFASVDVFVPGYEAAHTLTAAGFEPREAVHRTRRAISRLRNPAQRALRRAGIPNPGARFHSWTQLANRPPYARMLERVHQAYRTDEAVRRACRLTARGAVLHAAEREPSERQIDQAVGYALAELPLVLDGPAIFGTESSVFVYHREMDLLDPFITGRATRLRPASGQGYAVVRPADDRCVPSHRS